MSPEAIHRTSAALLGAVCMVGVGMLLGFYSQEAAIQAIDANTLLLLAAMMMLVAMLRPTGAFRRGRRPCIMSLSSKLTERARKLKRPPQRVGAARTVCSPVAFPLTLAGECQGP